MKLRTLLLPFVLLQHCFAQTAPSLEKTFKENNFKIQYPETWELNTSKSMGTEIILFSPLENTEDKFRENVNVLIQDLTGQNIDLKKYKQITDDQLVQMATNPEVEESVVIKEDGREFYQVTYSMTHSNFRLKITSFCFISNDKAYLATFSAEFHTYDEYQQVGLEILNSFSIVQ